MKKIIFITLFISILTACSKEDSRVENPNLFDVNVDFRVDLSLPQYNGLQFPSNPVLIRNYGNGGIYLMNTGGSYVAWDAADPNHPRDKNCPTMQLDGLRLVCPCDDNTYDLFTGNFVQGDNLEYTLYPYRVEISGNNSLHITN